MTTKEAKDKFEAVFLSSLSTSKKREIYLHQYLWHAFSYHRIPCLQYDEANRAFNNTPYKRAFAFFQHEKDDTPVLELPPDCLMADIERIIAENLPDIYVVDSKFRWVYIKTHEEGWGCGPYFYRPDGKYVY